MNEMRGRAAGRAWMLALFSAAALALLSPGVQTMSALPERLMLTPGENIALPGSARLDSGDTQASLKRSDNGLELRAGETPGKASLVFRWLGLLPVKQVEVQVRPQERLIPGGKSVGIAIETAGLVVVGTSDLGYSASPARLAGLRSGDVLTAVNGKALRSAQALSEALESNRIATIDYTRDGEPHEVSLTPAIDPRSGEPRIGAWVRAGTAGVGTLTFVDPETGRFGALGHAIADLDTGVTLPVEQGGLFESRVVEVHRGEQGAPGEIVGDFLSQPEQIGDVTLNSEYGIYGENYAGALTALPHSEGLPIAKRSEIRCGRAQLLTTVDDEIRRYDCEIERVQPDGRQTQRTLVVHITDPALIEKTGGIVQGMSGSPLIQDGRIIGAITHVFVNDPARGYGVCIQDMLDTAERALQAA